METAQKIFIFISLLEGVWCGTWNISMPDRIDVLNGSCVIINCRFDILTASEPDLTDTAAGIWFRTENGIKTTAFNSSRPTFFFKGNITGKLKDKDCTTIFYNANSSYKGIYNFRIEGRNTLKYTFAQKTVLINVTDSPPKPTVKMFKDQMEVQEVLEGSSVNLRCSSQTLCSSSPPTLTWSSTDKLQLYGNSRLQENQTEIISDLNITASALQHGVTFICTITYQLETRNTTAQNNITLRVQYAPKNTSVSVFPSDTILEGSSVTLTCSSDGNPIVLNYTWYRENGGQLQTGQNLTFNVTDRTQTGRYYCQARNQHGIQNSSASLFIQYPPTNTSISVTPSTAVLEGSRVTLICNTTANPALVNYTWYREIGGQIQLLQTGYNLTISVTNTIDTGRYYCVAQNKHGRQNSSVLLDIQFAPKNTSTSVFPSSIVLEGNPVTLICNTTANPVVLNYTWYREIGGQIQLLGTGYNFTFSITNATHSGWYYCVAQNMYGQQNSSKVLDIQYPPKNTLISAIPSSAVLEGDPVTLTCNSDANPALFNYTWYRDDGGQLEQLQTGFNLTIDVTNTTHTGMYYCVAENKHGQQNSSVLLDIQYPPKNTSTTVLPFNSLLEGNPVTLTCSSDANPALVNYTWYRENRGQIQLLQTGCNLTFSVTNPTHFGWYFCIAQNMHGQQNSSVLLDIQFSPKDTSISVTPSTAVLEGSRVTLICNTTANPALVNYTWYRDNGGQIQLLQTGNNLTISATNRAHSGQYYCIAQNKHGRQNSSVLLDIQYASEVFSSRCDKAQQTVCLCEVNGNPAPIVEWQVSGHPVTNSTNTLIREERFSKTSFKSFITVYQSLTFADTVRCVSANPRGTASILFQLVPSPQETTSISGSSVMIGFVIGALIVLLLFLIKYLCKRRELSESSSITSVENVTGFNLTNRAAPVAATGYVNKSMLSPAGATTNYPESPYYSTTNFTNTRPESREMSGDSSLNDDYAAARRYARHMQ